MAAEEMDEEPDVDDLLDELEALELAVADEDQDTQSRVRESIRMARRIDDPEPVFGRVIKGFDRHDAAEALVGSVVFGIPMAIEGGTLEAGEYLATHPIYFVGTLLAGVGIVAGLLYVAEIQDVRVVDPILGVIPRRPLGLLTIAALTAFSMMTAWGRVDWTDPWVALCQTTVCFVGMSIGGALGDILPGS
ncbi:DUF2391 domain-containing protein [Halolamina sp. CBA1230]|uniref:DUF2391 domain-containing protein n=1 Tax=Halolamina sp. CBA1230 TaxID=1853690 RepID=UPI0009A192BC|nr:DUF2391 domain-containing protein [Halolamina sp. CBA1230]QKY19516.1 DUF2391 domain-containing protein [Halolamina sp. CBA1230]